jgi:uncharacterized RDD family membrane protein YckC
MDGPQAVESTIREGVREPVQIANYIGRACRVEINTKGARELPDTAADIKYSLRQITSVTILPKCLPEHGAGAVSYLVPGINNMQSAEWFYASEGRQAGPVSEAELIRLIREGVVAPSTLVWHQGLANWVPWNSLHPGGATPSDAPPPTIPAYAAASGALPAHRFVYGGFWIRVLAYIVDAFIIGAIRKIILLPLGISLLERPYASPWFFAHIGELGAAGFVISLAYFVFFWVQYGATPGKMILKLKVVNPLGGPITVGQAICRYFAIILSWMTLGIGFIMAGIDDEKRALHDRLCDTRVIRVNEIPSLVF